MKKLWIYLAAIEFLFVNLGVTNQVPVHLSYEHYLKSPAYKSMLHDTGLEKERLSGFKKVRYYELSLINSFDGWVVFGTTDYVYDHFIVQIEESLSDVKKDYILYHEQSHVNDQSGTLISHKDSLLLISKLVPLKLQEAFAKKSKYRHILYEGMYKYVTDLTEIRARLNVLRKVALENSIYNPLYDKITIKQLRSLKEINDLSGDIDELLSIYTDENLVIILNTVS